jgi:flagellar hook assembly protein FlgD
MLQETLLQMNNGATVTEMAEALKKAVATVRQTGKSATITLTLKISPATKNVTDVVTVESSVKTKLPEPERGVTIFYTTDENDLVRNDPKQQTLPLRVVDINTPKASDLKEVG